MTEGPTLIQSVQRALQLLDAVSEDAQPATAKQLARRTGLALPTAYHILRTLVYEGYLEKIDDGYVLGKKVGALHASPSATSVVRLVRPALRTLRDQAKAASYLAVFTDGEIVLAEIADAPTTHRIDLWAGVQDSGHATAFGKCILANLDASSRTDYLARHRLHDLTPNTLTDRGALIHRLHTVPHFVEDREEYRLGTACIALPIRTPTQVGAIALAERAWRYKTLLANMPHLRDAATSISRALTVHQRMFV